jgi:hypothetical protein
MATGNFTVSAQAQTISTAITILEITAQAAAALFVTGAWISCGTTTAGTTRIQLLKKSATITSAASAPTPVMTNGTGSSGATIKWKASAEGTDGGIIREYNFRLDGGDVYWLPIPDGQIFLGAGAILALKFPAAPTSGAYSYGFEYREYV